MNDFSATNLKVEALTNPRNAVVVGISESDRNWGARVYRSLKRYGFPGSIYFVNPSRSELFGKRCYPDFRSLPEPPDHLIVVVPAAGVCQVLSDAAEVGARSAAVLSGGFGEANDEMGLALGARLRAVIAETGLGVSGPNCLGNFSGKHNYVTFIEPRPLRITKGPVALVGQSGGVLMYLNQALEERGCYAEYLITTGNEAGLQVSDYIAFFSSQPEIKVIICYIEALKGVERFKAACRLARDMGKHVVVIKLGRSDAGRSAAMAHTGSLAGAFEAFDALTGDVGAVLAETMDEAVELAELLSYSGSPAGKRMGAITYSGAYRGMLLDAAARSGVEFPPLTQPTLDCLNKLLGVGSFVSNPVDGGFGVLQSSETYRACIQAVHDDPNIDMLILQDTLPRAAGFNSLEEPGFSDLEKANIRLVEAFRANKGAKPIVCVSMASHSQTDFSRAIRNEAPHVSFLQEPNRALRVIGSLARRAELDRLSRDVRRASIVPSRDQQDACDLLRTDIEFGSEAIALNEARSKELLRAYGLPMPQERLARTAGEAVRAADAIGYPVVLKVVSAGISHKSDIGGVMLNLHDPDAVRSAWARIEQNIASNAATSQIDGMLVVKQIKDGLELVLGLNRDPEAGFVVMVGAGGVLLELIKDVSFAMPPISRERARDMLERTRAGRLLKGYRGAGPYEAEAVVDALVALGRIATDAGDVIQSIDINPFVVLPEGQGCAALDALVVLKRDGP